MAIHYFGYGSNMSSAIMDEWCTDYTLIGAARLHGWRRVINRRSQGWGGGVADIIEDEFDVVWGALYRISHADLQKLDIKEGNGIAYQRIAVEVLTHDDMAYRAVTYTVINKLPNAIPTTRPYRDAMLTGARELNLPADTIAELEQLSIVEESK